MENTENMGACRFCGEMSFVDNNLTDNGTQDERNNIATRNCTCQKSRSERDKIQRIESAKIRINQLFGELADEYGFEPIEEDGVIRLLNSAVYNIADGKILSMALEINGKTKAKLSRKSKGKIAVERAEATKYILEE